MHNSLMAGTAEVDNTPAPDCLLIHRHAESIHDNLYARILALQTEEIRVAVVSFDWTVLSQSFVDALKNRVGDVELFCFCTHTHASPVTDDFRGWAGDETEYLAEVEETVSSGVTEAFSRMEPAEVRYGEYPMQIGFNRRLDVDGFCHMIRNPDGPVDRRVRVLSLHSVGSKQPKSILYSHGCHPVVIHASTPAVSADYPGQISKKLKERYGQEFCPVFIQGCGADINVEVLDGTFADLERIGNEAAWSVGQAVENSQAVSVDEVRTGSTEIELPFRLPTEEEAVRAVEVGRLYAEKLEAEDPKAAHDFSTCGTPWADDLLKTARQPVMPNGCSMKVNALALGTDFCLVGLQAELFHRYQEKLAEVSPFTSTVVASFSGGAVNYLPTADEFRRGGYEVGNEDYADPILYAFKRYGTLTLDKSCEEATVDGVGRLLRQMGGQT